MKALTISQPFASLIADGSKWIENRLWGTEYRGLLAIHAGRGTQYLDRHELAEYPHGCVIAVCRLVACFRLVDLPRLSEKLSAINLTVEQVEQHEHTEGPWCWLLRDAQRLREPVPCRGAQGLWEVDNDLIRKAMQENEANL